MNELNDELETQQKENKHKIKTLKTKNKDLEKENSKLKKEIEIYKKDPQQSKKGKNINQSLLQANDDYKSLNQKYKKLQAQMNSKSSNGITNTNGSQTQTQSAQDNVLDIMNTAATIPMPMPTTVPAPITTAPVVQAANPFAADNDYDFWDYTNIIQWINGLENGRYKKYISIMQSRLKQNNIDGHTFVNWKLNDLKNCGCTNYNDAVQLHSHMKKLKESNNDAFDTPNTSNNNLNNFNIAPPQ
eukprot:901421_1